MASVLDWTYWHLGQAGTRRVLGGADPVLDYIAPGQLPPDEPSRQVAMSDSPWFIIRAVGWRPARRLAPCHAGRGCQSRIIS